MKVTPVKQKTLREEEQRGDALFKMVLQNRKKCHKMQTEDNG